MSNHDTEEDGPFLHLSKEEAASKTIETYRSLFIQYGLTAFLNEVKDRMTKLGDAVAIKEKCGAFKKAPWLFSMLRIEILGKYSTAHIDALQVDKDKNLHLSFPRFGVSINLTTHYPEICKYIGYSKEIKDEAN